jgi:electron transfer flavoprotein beta subunit
MNIVVCVKPVPDVSIVMLDPKTGLISSDDLVYTINPYDMVAVEKAVRIKEKDGSSQVTIMSVAPPSAKRLLRRCLAIGADDVILLWDSSFENLDSYATGVILAKAISSLHYDLILCGQKAIDTEAGQVGSIIAERLDIPLASRVVKIDLSPDSKKAAVESKLEKGKREQIEVTLPALLTIDMDLNEPRYASLPSLMAGLRKDVKEYNVAALGLSYAEVGPEGAKTRTVALSLPKPRPKKVFTPDSQLSAEERMRLIISGGVTQKQSDVLKGDPVKIASSMVRFLIEKKFLSTTEQTSR